MPTVCKETDNSSEYNFSIFFIISTVRYTFQRGRVAYRAMSSSKNLISWYSFWILGISTSLSFWCLVLPVNVKNLEVPERWPSQHICGESSRTCYLRWEGSRCGWGHSIASCDPELIDMKKWGQAPRTLAFLTFWQWGKFTPACPLRLSCHDELQPRTVNQNHLFLP